MKIPKLLYIALFLLITLGFLAVWNATYSVNWVVEKDSSAIAVFKYNKITNKMNVTGFITKTKKFIHYDLSKEKWPDKINEN